MSPVISIKSNDFSKQWLCLAWHYCHIFFNEMEYVTHNISLHSIPYENFWSCFLIIFKREDRIILPCTNKFSLVILPNLLILSIFQLKSNMGKSNVIGENFVKKMKGRDQGIWEINNYWIGAIVIVQQIRCLLCLGLTWVQSLLCQIT